MQKKSNMKYEIKQFKEILIFTLVVLMCWSCSEDDPALKIDYREQEIGDIIFTPINPVTSVAFTQNELADLDYDPNAEGHYLESQSIAIEIWTASKPLQLEIKSSGEAEAFATSDDISEKNDGYAIKWSSTVEDLGIDEGSIKTYDLVIVYDDFGVDGFEYPSLKSYTYKVMHESAQEAGPLALLQRSKTDVVELQLESIISGGGIEDGVGTFVELDGTKDFVTVTDNLDFMNTEDFSVSFWVNTTSKGDDPSIVGNKDWGGGGNPGFVLAFRGDKDVKLNIGDGTNRVDIKGTPVNDGAWHHIALTFDRDGLMSLYQDGVLTASDDMSMIGDMTNGFPLRIGQDGTGGYSKFFEGKVGGLVVNDYVMSNEEVQVALNKTASVLYFGASENGTLELENGAASVTIENGMTISEYLGAEFSTVNDPNKVLDYRFASDFSYGIWVKTTSTGDDPSIIGDKDWGSGGNPGFVLAFRGDKDIKLNLADGTNRVDIKGTPINDGEWHLIIASFDRDGNVTLYQDGVETASADMSMVGEMNSGMPIHIAQDGTGGYGHFFEGKVGRTVFFDHAITAEEASELYKSL